MTKARTLADFIGSDSDVKFDTDTLYIDSSANKVGIGTTTPLSTMHLKTTGGGSVHFEDSDATSSYNISEVSNNAGNFNIQTRNSSGTFVSTDYQIIKNASGADYHRWFTQGSERARIDASGNLLVGKTSSATNTVGVEIDGANGVGVFTRDGNTAIEANRKTSDGTIINLRKDGSTVGSIGTNTNGNFQLHGTAASHVGIQFGSPSILPVDNSGASDDDAVDLGDANTRFKDLYLSGGVVNGAANGQLYLQGGSSSSNGSGILLNGGSHAFTANTTIFRNGSSETMRIDASGNLLVGKTSAGLSTAGVQLDAAGSGGFCRADVALTLSRLSTNGSILDFRKDSTTVGNIGTSNNDLVIGSGSTNLWFDQGSAAFSPASSMTLGASNGSIDLGGSARRFKDLYLSGGAYIGGTTSANKLDDYEEGNWTPILKSGSTTISTSNPVGIYRKVGSMIFLQWSITRSDSTGHTNNLTIDNLPFNGQAVTYLIRMPSGTIWLDNGTGSDRIGWPYLTTANDLVFTQDYRVDGGNRYIKASNLTNGRPVYGSAHFITS